MIKLLHTADVHIGAPFKWLGEKGKEQRKQIKKTFSRIIEIAIVEKVDVLLIAGDLFDNNVQTQNEIDFVLSEFKRLEEKGIAVCLIGGTHDYLSANSVLRKCDFANRLRNVFLLDDQRPFTTFDEFSLTVFGQSLDTNKSARNPMENLIRGSLTKFNVGMIHGSAMIPGRYAKDDWPFPHEKIDDMDGVNYLACGHWHSYYQLPTKKVKAAYSGSPELIATDQIESGNVLLVMISDEGTTEVYPKKVGARKVIRVELDAGKAFGNKFIEAEISKLQDPNLILEISIKGLTSLENKKSISIDDIGDKFENGFFKLIIRDNSHINIEEVNLNNYQENVTIGKFVRMMQKKIADTKDEEERKIAEDALQYGIALLEGRVILE